MKNNLLMSEEIKENSWKKMIRTDSDVNNVHIREEINNNLNET